MLDPEPDPYQMNKDPKPRLQLCLLLTGYIGLFYCRFGDGLPSDGLSGWVVPAEPLHGCLPIKPPPAYVSLPPTYFWIAIIERSVPGSTHECTFQVPVLRSAMLIWESRYM
jgi:hypothetical protein